VTPEPTATPQTPWVVYTHEEGGFDLEAPPDWTIDDSEEGRVDVVGPGGYAAVHIFFSWVPASSVGAWADDTVPGLMEYHREHFELVERKVRENADGTGIAAMAYWGQTAPEFCLTYRLRAFVVLEDWRLEAETRVCEEFLEEYQPLVESVLNSIGEVDDDAERGQPGVRS